MKTTFFFFNGYKKQVTLKIKLLFCSMMLSLFPAFSQPVDRSDYQEKLISFKEIKTLDSVLINRLEQIEDRYGIQLYVQEVNKDIPRADSVRREYLSYQLLDNKLVPNRNKLLQIFAEEWEKYPDDFVKSSQLKSIVFVAKLAVSGQQRYAMPDAGLGALYFDVTYANNRTDEYLRHCIHHEFHHLVQFNTFNDYYYKDPTWISFNKKKFSYGSGGATAYAKPAYSKKKHPMKGFVTGYATYGVEEDIAELFAYCMTTSEFPVLLKWTKGDNILANKMAYLLGMLSVQSKQFNTDYLLKLHHVPEAP